MRRSAASCGASRGLTDSHRAFRTSHFSLKYFQARFLPWGFLPTWMMTSMTSCSGTRSEVRDRLSNLGDTDTELTDRPWKEELQTRSCNLSTKGGICRVESDELRLDLLSGCLCQTRNHSKQRRHFEERQ